LATAALKWAMKSKSVAAGEERTFVLILDQGEEAFKAITDFANKQGISGASVSAVGAFAEARVGWFDLSRAGSKIEARAQGLRASGVRLPGRSLTH
jgi:predicted DNA-binding protein with PD1-like motif